MKSDIKRSTVCAVTVFLSLNLLAGCGAKKEEESIDVEGCEHLQEGPAVALTAVASGTGPAIKDDHQRYDVTLVDLAGGKGGRVSLASSAAGEYVFFLSADVAMTALDANEAEMEAEKVEKSSAECADVKGRVVLPLLVGTYHLSFGPTTQEKVSVVVEKDESEHGH